MQIIYPIRSTNKQLIKWICAYKEQPPTAFCSFFLNNIFYNTSKLVFYHPTINTLSNFLSWLHRLFSLIYVYHTFSKWSIFKYFTTTQKKGGKFDQQPFDLHLIFSKHWSSIIRFIGISLNFQQFNLLSQISVLPTVELVPSTIL